MVEFGIISSDPLRRRQHLCLPVNLLWTWWSILMRRLLAMARHFWLNSARRLECRSRLPAIRRGLSLVQGWTRVVLSIGNAPLLATVYCCRHVLAISMWKVFRLSCVWARQLVLQCCLLAGLPVVKGCR